MKTLREPKHRPAARTVIKLDDTIGEESWRTAANAYTRSQEYLRRLGNEASEKVVPLRNFKKGSEKAFREHSEWAREARAAAIKVIFAPAPNPRELANKLKLLAFLHDLPDPAGAYPTSDMTVARAAEAGWAPLADMLSQLWLDAQLLNQCHDAEAFTPSGKRRRKSKSK
jgi:hypothetical protein